MGTPTGVTDGRARCTLIPHGDFDAVIVGGGFAGAIIAKELTRAGMRVALLEAGTDGALGPENYAKRVEQNLRASAQVPNAPYGASEAAPQADVLDLPTERSPDTYPWTKGYLVQNGPQPFGSDFTRMLGGTSLHWLGESLRMVPTDFELKTNFGVGVDWPLAYADLEPLYRRAELELGVAADVEDQAVCGIWFEPGYVFPMRRIPLSYSDTYVQARLKETTVSFGGDPYALRVGSTPVSRNSIPHAADVPPRTSRAPRERGRELAARPGYVPVGMVGDPLEGQRCQGNASCVPICPVQAKYVALKTLASIDGTLLTTFTHSVVTNVSIDANGVVTGVSGTWYEDPNSLQGATPFNVTGKFYVLACNAIENAKLLLLSRLANESDQLGRNLMDHPWPLHWATLADTVGTFRGPGSTAGIDTLRDGPFRASSAAFRVTISNWGWNLPLGAPVSDVRHLVTPTATERRYATRFGHSAPFRRAPAKSIFGRALRSSLYDTVNRHLTLGMLVEQDPQPTNRVTLSNTDDALGIPRPAIDYNLSDYTKRGIANAMIAANTVFNAIGAVTETLYAESDPQSFVLDGTLYMWRGAGHIAGTHRMGRERSSSVVDTDGRCWQHPNLFLAGAGNMPTMGTSNPTLTLCALAYRTAGAIRSSMEAR